tara:strand:- start:12 stop:305 length:294 start_codon:yes stop_codon:yes gene_type:complete
MKKSKKGIFSRSIHLMVTPVDKGFSCSVVGDNKENMSEDEYDLCNTIARGMIKLSNDNPNKVYSEGVEALSEDHKNKDSNIVDFLEFLKVRTFKSIN